MTNPYEPPKTSETTTPTEPRFYGAGWWPISIFSIVIGGAVGGLFSSYANSSASLFAPLIVQAVGWLGATTLLMFMIRDSKLTITGKVLFALLLPIPAYLLFVPVCVVSSICTFPFLGQIEYGPSTSGHIVASAFGFLLVLMRIAVFVRKRYRIDGVVVPTRLEQ